MAADHLQRCDSVEDDYIDMEVSAFSDFFCNSNNNNNNNNNREFEFQMLNRSLERETTLTSPADELFYKGKLLPLHLPPRLEMVEKLLETTKDYSYSNFDDFYCTPLATTTTTTPTAASTPFQSCNVSPAESCQVSKELNPEEYFLECSADVSECIVENPKKSWTRNLRLIKQSSFGSKLKASKAFLRSFFGKSGCSDESCTSAAKVVDEGSFSKANNFKQQAFNKYSKIENSRNNFGQIQNERRKTQNSISGRHRRSFSVSMRRQSTKNNSTQMASRNSNTATGFHPLQFLKRSTSSSSEIENSIQGAILHCKQSLQQIHHPGKAVNDIGFSSLSASRIAAADDQERAQLFRG